MLQLILALTLTITPGAFDLYGAGCAAVSPDGAVFLGIGGEPTDPLSVYIYDIHTMTLEAKEPLTLTGAGQVMGCVWAPDGNSYWVLRNDFFNPPRRAWLSRVAYPGSTESASYEITEYLQSQFGASGLGYIRDAGLLIVAQYWPESLLLDPATGQQVGTHWEHGFLHTGWDWSGEYVVMRAQHGSWRASPAESRVYIWRDGKLALGQTWPLMVSSSGNMTDIALAYHGGWFHAFHWVSRPAGGRLEQDLIIGQGVPLLFDPLDSGPAAAVED